jgi:prephenate dehydrogenase
MKTTIIGVGLIGGSMALKLKSTGFTNSVFGVDHSTAHLEEALSMGMIDEISSLENAISQSDLIILAIPVDATEFFLPGVLDLIQDHHTVLDVGSTKLRIVNAVKNHPNRNRFLAFHPMWGTENSGPKSASVESFSGRAAVLCDRQNSAEDAVKVVDNIVKHIGMHLIEMSAEAHDLHTAYISHITSYALANTVLEKGREEDTIFQLASSGFDSTVRLAKSHPEMWIPIFKANRENILDVLNEHISQLRKFKAALEKENDELLEDLIRNTNKIREILR